MKTKLLTLVFLLLNSIAYGAKDYYQDFFYKTNNKCNDYAVIIIGGYEDSNYWNLFLTEAYKSYQFFVNVKGCDPSRVKVLCQNGPKLNLDGDAAGTIDVQGASTQENVTSLFNDLSSKLTNNDVLHLVFFGHGLEDWIHLHDFIMRPPYLNENLAKLKYKKANFYLYSCHSGSWIDNLKDSRHTVITVSAAKNVGRMDVTGSTISSQMYLALAGKMRCYRNPDDWADLIKNPISANADYNNDGVVSLEEAFVYAKDHEKYSKPGGTISLEDKAVPRYWSGDTPWRFCRPEEWGVVDTTINVSRNAHEIKAMYLLNATGTISGSADVTLSSGKMIRLKKGFKVNKGAKFRTYYIDCEDEKNDNPNELRKFEIVDQEAERENGAADITVSPNPSTGRFIVTLGEVEADVTVLDMQGRVIRQFANASGDFELDITDFPNGVYVLALNSANFKLTQKIVKY